ncbi:MAG: hypothetical protein IJC27_01210, partial [Lentisphaeria bacterium]|nr:hypothetical protein [Lentisphaeria bacterium]
WRPRMRDFVLASGMRVWWWFDSCVAKFHPLPPFLATGGMKFAPRVPLSGKKFPRPPCPGVALCEDGSRRRATLAATLTEDCYTFYLKSAIAQTSVLSNGFFLPANPSK